jgi:hypothetical protein
MNRRDGFVLGSAELIARKMKTLSSMWVSFFNMIRDGQNPRVFDHVCNAGCTDLNLGNAFQPARVCANLFIIVRQQPPTDKSKIVTLQQPPNMLFTK